VKRIRTANALSFAGLTLFAALWCRSGWRSDVAAYFTPGGAVQAVGSHRGTVILFLSTVRARPKRAANVIDLESIDPRYFDGVVECCRRSWRRTWHSPASAWHPAT
jgi:hypothetical protein